MGLTLAYPASVGLLWPVSITCALRPEISGSLRSNDSTVTSGTGQVSSGGSSDNRALGGGLSVLFYVRKWEDLRVYVTPRFAYTRSTSTSDTSDYVASDYLVSGSVGFEYSLGRRFGIFAEIGVSYDRQTSSNNVAGTGVTAGSVLDTTISTTGPRSGIGAIFRF